MVFVAVVHIVEKLSGPWTMDTTILKFLPSYGELLASVD